MIKLSDYLDYLYSEIIQARKKADEKSVLVAKEYANHEYLKFFKAPRFAFPAIKMDIPLKVNDISAQSKYDFKLDEAKFLSNLNERITAVNKEKQLNISLVTKEQIQNQEFKQLFSTLEKKDRKLVKNIDDEVKKIERSYLRGKFYSLTSLSPFYSIYGSNDGVQQLLLRGFAIPATKQNRSYKDFDSGIIARSTYRNYTIAFEATVGAQTEISHVDFEVTDNYNNDKLR